MPPPTRRNIFIQCNPLLDITVEVDEDFLRHHHLNPDEEFIYHAGFKGVFEDLEASGTSATAPGGAGLNTARVAQWLLHRQQGTCAGKANLPCVCYVGCVGDDANGKILMAQAEADGVRMCLEVTSKAPTGICAVFKVLRAASSTRDTQERKTPSAHACSRSLVANLGAATELSSTFLASAEVQAALDSAAVVYSNAYATPFHARQILALAAATRREDAATEGAKSLFAFGLSSKSIMDVFGEDLVDLLNKMDIVFGNEEEMTDLAAMLLWDPEAKLTDAELVARLAKEMPYDGHANRRVIVMTRGRQPVLYATSAGESGEVPVLSAEAGHTEDAPPPKHFATGTGDAFVGGYLAAHVAGHAEDIARCVRAGVQAATYVVTHSIQTLEKGAAPEM